MKVKKAASGGVPDTYKSPMNCHALSTLSIVSEGHPSLVLSYQCLFAPATGHREQRGTASQAARRPTRGAPCDPIAPIGLESRPSDYPVSWS